MIVAVNGKDIKSVSSRLRKYELESHKYNVTVFGMVRGIKSASTLRDELDGLKHVVFIECVIGFSVVPHPSTSALKCTTNVPGIALERMTKEVNEVAGGPVNLIETIGWEMLFRKILTPMGWGTLIYENLYALNAIAGGTLAETLSNSTTRNILADMVRDCRIALVTAAMGKGWKPDLTLVSF